jgi:ribosomal protein L12E/L44/L45/RPP1/RPP2
MEDDETYKYESIEALRAILNSLTDSTRDFAETEFNRIVESDGVKGRVRQVMPYIYAGAFLSFSGREINEKNLSKVLKVVGMTADKDMVKLLFSSKLRCHFPYIYAYYFLLAFGKIGTEKEILEVVNSLGLHTDKARLKDVLGFLNQSKGGPLKF